MSETRGLGRRRLDSLGDELSRRDHAVIRSLQELHFATTRHIERLHFQGTGLTPLSATRSTNRALERLHRFGLVDRLPRRIGGHQPGSASYVWRLSPAGARLAGLPPKRRDEPGRTYLDHVLDVSELVVQLRETSRNSDVDLLLVETEPRCWRRYLTPAGTTRWLKPDLATTLGIGPVARHWFVEVDRDTENRPRLHRKMSVYMAAWHDGGIQAALGVFPGVLWTAPTTARRQALDEVIADTGAPQGMFRAARFDEAIDSLTGIAP